MNVWTWLKFVTLLWLLRKGFKLARWLMVVAAAVAVWPVTVVAGTGYAAAWLRGWPPVRVYRTAAWTLIMTAAWLVALEASEPGFLAAREPGRTWGVGWDQLTIAGLVRTFAGTELDAFLSETKKRLAAPREKSRRKPVASNGE